MPEFPGDLWSFCTNSSWPEPSHVFLGLFASNLHVTSELLENSNTGNLSALFSIKFCISMLWLFACGGAQLRGECSIVIANPTLTSDRAPFRFPQSSPQPHITALFCPSPLPASAACFPPAPPPSLGQLFPAPASGLMPLPLPPQNLPSHCSASTALMPLPWLVVPGFNVDINYLPILMSMGNGHAHVEDFSRSFE